MKTKTTLMKMLMLGASVLATSEVANAQWQLTGNPAATNTSILGATGAGINLRLFAGGSAAANERIRILGSNGNVGIGTIAPTTKLHVVGTSRLQGATAIVGATTITGAATVSGLTTTGTLKVTGGAPGVNKILRSDANGLATWVAASSVETDPQVGTNTTNRIPRWNGTSLITGTIFDNGTNVGVGTLTPACKLAVASNSLGGIGTIGSSQIGENDTYNLVFDNNEVQARVNGIGSDLYLQFWGGDLDICQSGGTTNFGGPISASGRFTTLGKINTSSVVVSGTIATDNNLSIDNADGSRNPGMSLWSSVSTGGGAIYGRINGFTGINVADEAGSAYAEVAASAFNVTSDRRMKKDIVDIDASQYEKYMQQIRNIESATFRYTHESDITRPVPHLGVIAQSLPAEVQAHISSTPSSTDNQRLGVSLADMQGLLLVGIKALDSKVTAMSPANVDQLKKDNETLKASNENLKARLDQIEKDLQSCCINHSSNEKLQSTASDIAHLEQNAPNPFSEETVIHYYLPSNSTAVLKITSLDGKQISSTVLSKSGYGEMIISGTTMAAGTYTYSLIVNGKAIESKIMVLTK